MRVCASATVRRFPPLVWKAKRRGGASTVLARNLQPSCSANLDVSATEVFSPSFVSTVRSHGGVSLAQVRPTHGIEGERPKWCIQCPDKPPEAIAVHAPKCKDPKAMYLAGVRCECPRQVHATFGMPCLVSGCGGVPSVPDDFPDCTTRRQLDANASDPSNPCMASPKIRAPIGAPSASHTVRSTSSPCDVIVRGIIEFRTATQGNGLVGAPNAPIALQRRSTSTATCANVIRRTEPPLGTQASVLAGARNAPTGRPVRRTPGLRNVSVNAEWFPPSASLASAGAGVHNVRCDPPRLRTRTVLFASARVVPMPLTDILEAAGCGAANARPGLPTQRLSPTYPVLVLGNRWPPTVDRMVLPSGATSVPTNWQNSSTSERRCALANERCGPPGATRSNWEGYCMACFSRKYPHRRTARNWCTKELAEATELTTYLAQYHPHVQVLADTRVHGTRLRPDLLLRWTGDYGDVHVIVEVDEYMHTSADGHPGPPAWQARLDHLVEVVDDLILNEPIESFSVQDLFYGENGDRME
ncbi:hypothetical protein CXG81DRAFT_21457 [Caulochytrium protostelioides]|uniref:Uncharacterized protein n=1 Tax=Caulochytrium protostelioides TaxID=1555241 RepID=A0A4P9X0N7_9FUNG|nr:hypothetical protein CXG81DRAFT_21457 [Caulochytrium protostelioides]|eukprot:RKO98293.1 hypothetical protein CXG81DRAFT_21457 [Caulochytrium protostelioides]